MHTAAPSNIIFYAVKWRKQADGIIGSIFGVRHAASE
jgi:hypothetical protein